MDVSLYLVEMFRRTWPILLDHRNVRQVLQNCNNRADFKNIKQLEDTNQPPVPFGKLSDSEIIYESSTLKTYSNAPTTTTSKPWKWHR